MTFLEECYALLGEYGKNFKPCVYESTEIILDLIGNNNHEVMITKSSKLLPGKFYLMKYEYIDDKYFAEKYNENKTVPSLKPNHNLPLRSLWLVVGFLIVTVSGNRTW